MARLTAPKICHPVPPPPTRTARTKIRTIPGPAPAREPHQLSFPLVRWVQSLYHQETKNLLVSYSPKRLGFF
ncbi:hypothetical protein Slala04_65440 [Streptomyces lavendulae subsp. lavendulae]|nr:hypothetical protein Slala04_65440 [Streptomyces lavendulae subsp. lavendulae]